MVNLYSKKVHRVIPDTAQTKNLRKHLWSGTDVVSGWIWMTANTTHCLEARMGLALYLWLYLIRATKYLFLIPDTPDLSVLRSWSVRFLWRMIYYRNTISKLTRKRFRKKYPQKQKQFGLISRQTRRDR